MRKLLVYFMRKAGICLVLLLSVASCTKAQHRSGSNVASETRILATIADNDMPPPPPVSHSEKPDPQLQQASFQVIFSESGRGVAYLVQKGDKLSVVHNQSRGKEYSALGTVVISGDGGRVAYGALTGGKWSMVVDGKEGKGYETLLTPLFSPDGRHVAYLAKEGDRWYLVVDGMPNAGTIASYTTPEFSSDSTKIVYIETAASSAEMKLIISDLTFRSQQVKKSIGDLLFILNKDKNHLAATEVVGKKLRVIDFSIDKPELVRTGALYDLIERLTINDVGDSVTYCALKDGKRLIVLNDREETLPKGLLPELPLVRPDKKGVGILLGSEKILDPLADKLCLASVALYFLWIGQLPLWFVLFAVLRDILIFVGAGYVKFRHSVVTTSLWPGKWAVGFVSMMFIAIVWSMVWPHAFFKQYPVKEFFLYLSAFMLLYSFLLYCVRFFKIHKGMEYKA